MKITEFLKLISPYINLCGNIMDESRVVKKLSVDSREVDDKTVFFCLKGEKADGHSYIDRSIKKGVAVIVGEKDLKIDNYIKVGSTRKTLEAISSSFYGDPQNFLKMIGITGTNGKTTVSYMIENGLKEITPTAVIGTLGYKIEDKTVYVPNTTPFIWKWYELLSEIREHNVKTVVAEISSHGLDQDRIKGTLFDVAVFTNLSRDHLDYHKDEESYYQAKKKLFTCYLKKEGRAVINIDTPYGSRLFNELPCEMDKKSVSLKDKNSALYVEIISESPTGTFVNFNYKGEAAKGHVSMIGRFNVYNAACAVMAVEKFAGFKKAVENVCVKTVVSGRMEMVGGKPVFIDYAHTPDALCNILSSVKKSAEKGRIIVVFGAGGDRDKGKRKEMGKIVSEMADIAIVTDDNPRTENPQDIVKEIVDGFLKNECQKVVIHDRRKAIRHAVKLMKEDDIVIIAGKGAEDYQIVGTEKQRFSDKEEVEIILRELKDV